MLKSKPIFDLQVTAEKKSPFSRAAQNEMAKELYSMGLFNPDMAEPALVCLDMMDFEGKDEIKKKVQDNSMLMGRIQQMVGAIQAFDAAYPQFGLAQVAGLQSEMQMPQQNQQSRGNGNVDTEGTPEERAAKTEGEATRVANARKKTAEQTLAR